jgi:predicted small secreted protein
MKLLIAVITAAWLLSACNTVQGIGQDLKKAGEKIDEAAKKK